MLLSDEVKQQLERDGIALATVESLLTATSSEKVSFIDEAGSYVVSGGVVGTIMLWVKYRNRGEDKEVLGAYYHRMKVAGTSQ